MLAASNKSGVIGLLLVGSLFFAGCATAPWYLSATDHYGQTFRTRDFPSEVDVFVGPVFDLFGNYDLESVLVGLQKEADAGYIVLKVQSTLSNGNGNPFQHAQANGEALHLTHLSLKKRVALKEDFTSIDMTIERLSIRIPLSLASSAACDSKDFVIRLAGKGKEPFDLDLPRAMLQGFLGKVKKSGENEIEGECFDQFG